MKCARCNRSIQAAAGWSGGAPLGPTCARIMDVLPVVVPGEKSAHAAIPSPRRGWVDEGQQELFEGFDMSRKKCIRKHWNVAPGFNPVQHAIAGACVTNKKTLDALTMRILSALEAMTHGNGTLADFKELVDLSNVCETAGLSGLGPEVLPWCKQADDALKEAASRFEASRVFGLSGAGIQAIRELVEYHRLQILSVARSEYEALVKKTADRLRTGNCETMVVL